MKKFLSYFVVGVLILTLAGGSAFSAESNSSNASKYSHGNYFPIASPLDVIKELRDQIAKLPDNAFIDVKKTKHSKSHLDKKLEDIIKKLKDGNYESARKYLSENFKKDMEKSIVLQEHALLLAKIDTILVSIEHACETTVKISSGKVAGLSLEPDCWTWVGIPYAKPPVGKLRWKAPREPKPWKGIRFSTFDLSRSIQNEQTLYWSPTGQVIGSEDCLYLNVCRPKTKEKNLPVYFWIHGGGNVTGGAEDFFFAQFLAQKYNVVVVVVEYRLGAMGWLTHPALTSNGTVEDKSGNFGTLDIIKALKWVQGNIRQFGGNPKNVTVAGQSAGGTNVLSLMVSPLAKDLFHKAVVESSGLVNISVEKGVEKTNNIIDKLLVADNTCADLESAAAHRKIMTNKEIEAYLRSKSAVEITKAYPTSAEPIIDGNVITDTVASAFESGNYNKVPIIIGSNEDEYKPFLPLMIADFPTYTGHKWSDIQSVLGVNGKSMTLEEVMPADSQDRQFFELLAKYPSMNWKATMVDSLAGSLKKHQDDVYCYYFKWKGKGAKVPFDFLVGAGHSFELPFFFGWDKDLWNISYTEENEKGRIALQDAIMSYVSSFASTGNPNKGNSSLPNWEKWSNIPNEPKSIIFDADLNESKISMMNEEFKKEDIMMEVNNLTEWQKNVIFNIIWF
ncbi:carboxylesterase/lipase family protein [Pseudobacteroides cellulosolvens]|uniref:Carboxylic ester hydrolase n=1 Tax=Pseudobacteroides cellulosolvens ATCC 35603 = DSM 2933 TaxID=398512 RepID=A0A0L6JW12_9FIRM|nr:carboxylesterase family protein [Pseudobacteroides cellulosolvens]KNY29622.1 Carboxylesterase type B [Pseudobacteroides cellulosolvens ATCC 35603 = DSM 2933]